MKRTKKIVGMCIFVIALAWAQGPTRFKPGFNLFSKEQDVQVGQESAAQVRKQMTMVKDPFLNQYINSIGKRLANAQEAKESGASLSPSKSLRIHRSTPSRCPVVRCSSTAAC